MYTIVAFIESSKLREKVKSCLNMDPARAGAIAPALREV